MGYHLYIFDGLPGLGQAESGNKILHAGGLQYCIEDVEELAILEHSPTIQCRKEGVFTGDGGEWIAAFQYHISQGCLANEITWDWFSMNFCFGNGVTMHKSEGPDSVTPLTWIVTDYALPTFAYDRIRDIVERDATLKHPDRYSLEPGKHFATTRTLKPKRRQYVIPQYPPGI